jgi:hypothetical protein
MHLARPGLYRISFDRRKYVDGLIGINTNLIDKPEQKNETPAQQH